MLICPVTPGTKAGRGFLSSPTHGTALQDGTCGTESGTELRDGIRVKVNADSGTPTAPLSSVTGLTNFSRLTGESGIRWARAETVCRVSGDMNSFPSRETA
jgi:hypothetical protein